MQRTHSLGMVCLLHALCKAVETHLQPLCAFTPLLQAAVGNSRHVECYVLCRCATCLPQHACCALCAVCHRPMSMVPSLTLTNVQLALPAHELAHLQRRAQQARSFLLPLSGMAGDVASCVRSCFCSCLSTTIGYCRICLPTLRPCQGVCHSTLHDTPVLPCSGFV